MALRPNNPYISYLGIGFILVILFVGSVFALNRHSQQVRKDQEVAKEADRKKTESNKSPSKTSGSSQANKNTNTSSQQASTTSTTQENKGSNTQTTASSRTIPQTGPEVNVGRIAMLYILTVAIVSYYLSRKSLYRSL